MRRRARRSAQPLGGMHGSVHTTVVAFRVGGPRNRKRSIFGSTFLWKDSSICCERANCRFRSTWRNCLVAFAGRAVSDCSNFCHWNYVRGRHKFNVLVVGAMARRCDNTCGSPQAREATIVSELSCRLTNRWSARVEDKVPSSCSSARGAQLNR
jgi:hypothetical protein